MVLKIWVVLGSFVRGLASGDGLLGPGCSLSALDKVSDVRVPGCGPLRNVTDPMGGVRCVLRGGTARRGEGKEVSLTVTYLEGTGRVFPRSGFF